MTSRRDRGQSLVEFALVLPIFVVLLVGLFDVGRAVFAYSTLTNAAKEAGRLAIVDQTLAHIRQEAVDQSLNLHVPASDVAVSYLSPDGAGPCSSQTAPPIGCIAMVTVSYSYDPVLPVIEYVVGPITLTGETALPIEATCVQPPAAACPKGS
jgi:Flp pilus assembly protein TadG